jgi:hypothetical protein
MTDTESRKQFTDAAAHRPGERRQPTGWAGMVVFAGVMLMILGSFQIIEGFVALFKDEFYLVPRSGLLITMDFTAWGWTHILIGTVGVLTGVGVLLGQMWARVIGIGVAVLSALANLAFLSAYPIWSTIVIALDVIVIYALTVHGREVKY